MKDAVVCEEVMAVLRPSFPVHNPGTHDGGMDGRPVKEEESVRQDTIQSTIGLRFLFPGSSIGFLPSRELFTATVILPLHCFLFEALG